MRRRRGQKGNGRAQALTTLNQGLGRPHTSPREPIALQRRKRAWWLPNREICRTKFDWPGTSRPAIGWASGFAEPVVRASPIHRRRPRFGTFGAPLTALTRPAPRSAPLPCCNKPAPDEHTTVLHGVCVAQCFWTPIRGLALRCRAAALLLACTGRHVLTPPPHAYHFPFYLLQLRWVTAHVTKRLRLASAGSGRRSARAACSASAGRCASAPGKADVAVCPAAQSCFRLFSRSRVGNTLWRSWQQRHTSIS